MTSSRWSCAILVAALFIATNSVSVAQAQAPDAAEWLTAHNAARSAEGVGLPPLTWSDAAYQFALSWAQNRSASVGTCAMVHSSAGRPYGENIAWNFDTASTPTSVVVDWVSEKANYDYAENYCYAVCGHYTQVVWKATTSVGCASIDVPESVCVIDGRPWTGGKFFICSYDPPGNDGSRPY
jgi:pathogenesis-related protein 1